MKQLLFLLLAAACRLAAQQTPQDTWGQWLYQHQNAGSKQITSGLTPLDLHWQVKGWGPLPDPVCTSLKDVWIMPDGSYRYCNGGVYVNPFQALTIGPASASADGLLSKTDFVNLQALQSAAFQPATAFEPAGAAAAAQGAAISQASAAIAALHLKSASQQDASAFDAAGAAASAQTAAISTAQTNTAAAIAALNLGSAATQPASAFDPAGAATAAVAGLPLASASTSGLLNQTDWASFNSKQNALGFTPLSPSANLSELSNPATARVNLGLGSAATQPSSAFDAAGAAGAAVAGIPTASASANGLLSKTDWASFNSKQTALGYVPLNPANALSELSASAATARGNLGLAPVASSGSYNDLTNRPVIPAAQVQSDWNAAAGVAQILNKPILGTAAAQNSAAFDAAGAAAAAQGASLQKSSNLSDLANAATARTNLGLALVASSGSYNDLSNKPSIPAAQVNADWNAATGLAQILNKPMIPAAQVNSDWNAASGLAQILNKPVLSTVATSGSYNDLSNKPTLSTLGGASLSGNNTFTGTNTFGVLTASSGNVNFGLPSLSFTADLFLSGPGTWARSYRLLNTNVAAPQRAVFGALGTGSAGTVSYAFFGVSDSTNDATGYDSTKTIKVDSSGNATVQQSLTVSGSTALNGAVTGTLGSWQSYTPTVTPSGSMTASGLSVTSAQYLRVGSLVTFNVQLTLTLGGTASNTLNVSLPVALVGGQTAMSAYLQLPSSTWSNAMAWAAAGSSAAVSLSGQGNYTLGSVSLQISGTYRVQ